MKCDICGEATTINWGNGEVVLCIKHKDSDIRKLENERIEKRINESCYSLRCLSSEEVKAKQWEFYFFAPKITVGLMVIGLSPGIILTSLWQSNYLLLTILLPAFSVLLSKELRIMFEQHDMFFSVTKRSLFLIGCLNVAFLKWEAFFVAMLLLFTIAFYWFFKAQYYFYLTDFK